MHNVRPKTSGLIFFISTFPLSLYFMFFMCTIVLPDAYAARDPHDEYKQMQKDLQIHKKKLESANRIERSVLVELRRTTAELNEIEDQLNIQRKKIKKIQGSIAGVADEIDNYKKSMQMQSGHLKKRLQTLQRLNKGNDAVLVLISGLDAARAFRTMRHLRDVSSYDQTIINDYKEALNVLDEKQNRLRKLSVELKSEEKKMAAMEESLKGKKAERETLLISVRKEKRSYQQMIRELQEASQKLLNIILEAERREKESRKKRAGKTKPGTKEEDHDEDSTFSRLKGRLPWPASGNVAIQYGTQVDPLFNLPVFRSGIHIKTSHGTPVKAVSEGKIVFADEFKGYGQLIIVSHGGSYHTLYGNLSRIFFQKGAIIKENEAIGAVGESSALGTSGLYFEIRYKGKPLDPRQWLRR